MKEYVEREAALAKITEQIDIAHFPVDHNIGLSRAASAINSLPTADVRENVRGEWVEKETIDRIYHVCSACGKPSRRPDYETSYILSDFCPNCGAQMKEATE